MANPIEYIVFEPDQVLTNDHLNETFNYLDQQNRWTRNKLIGIGIVCGLEIVLKTGVIEITKGCGITSQGYLITQDITDYTYYIQYAAVPLPGDLPFAHGTNLPFFQPFCQGKDVWQLLTDAQYQALSAAQKLTAVTISSATNFLKDYAVVLFLEANETDLKNCNMLDCNNSGSTMAFNIRPLLVAIADLPAVAVGSGGTEVVNVGNQTAPQTPVLKRYNVPYADLNNTNDVINAFVNLVDDATLTLISNAYTYCFQKYGGILNISTNPFASLLTNLQKYRSLITGQNPVYIQYFYDLVDDLIKAYHEFTARVSGMETTCCPDENLFPLHLILGAASTATSAYTTDPYRNYFIYSALFSTIAEDNAAAGLLFNRMVIIANSFTIASSSAQLQATIKITPSQYEHFPLSQRAIPYYYKLNTAGTELYKYWSYQKTSHGNAANNLSYNASLYSSAAPIVTPLLFDIERFNFFRVEGHIGQQQDTALSNIQNLVSTYNLPFDVVAVSADQLSSGATLPQCNMNDLDVDYNLIIAEAACKIHLTFCYITKLPFETYTSEAKSRTYAMLDVTKPKVQKFSAFKMDQETILPETAETSAVYTKGDFMRKYCAPLANTIGSAYLKSLTSTGILKNPLKLYENNKLIQFYFYLFEFVDIVETMMYELNTITLADLDIATFDEIYKRYIEAAIIVLTMLTEVTITADEKASDNAKFVSLTEDLQLDLLIDDLMLLTTICIDDRLQVLKTEYNNRLKNYQQQLNFLTYFKNHTGLEHKAGVPKGGTFVLVYHSGDPDTDITATTAASATAATTAATAGAAAGTAATEAGGARIGVPKIEFNESTGRVAATPGEVAQQKATFASEYNISDSDLNVLRRFVNDCKDAPPATKETVIGILKRAPRRPQQPTYSIKDGTVIADFYIPYLCCSDCPPVAYITAPPSQPQQTKPTITMDTTFCDSDTKPEPIKPSAPNGTLSITTANGGAAKGLDAKNFTFTPSLAGAGTYEITYTLPGGVASDPVEVTVVATPAEPDFSVKSTVKFTQEGIFTIDVTFNAVSPNDNYTYDWTFGNGFPETTATGDPVDMTVTYNPEKDGTIETTASLTASNGNCPGAAITKNLAITANGVFEVGSTEQGGFLKGIESLFNKKKKKP